MDLTDVDKFVWDIYSEVWPINTSLMVHSKIIIIIIQQYLDTENVSSICIWTASAHREHHILRSASGSTQL